MTTPGPKRVTNSNPSIALALLSNLVPTLTNTGAAVNPEKPEEEEAPF